MILYLTSTKILQGGLLTIDRHPIGEGYGMLERDMYVYIFIVSVLLRIYQHIWQRNRLWKIQNQNFRGRSISVFLTIWRSNGSNYEMSKINTQLIIMT